MWRNYLITAYRNLLRNRIYAAMNILGLTLGVTCFSIIALYLHNEMGYDQFHEQASYRFLYNEQTGSGASRTAGIVSIETLDQIEGNVAGVEDKIMLRDYGSGPLAILYKDVKFKSRNMMFAESDFFDYFSFELKRGDTKTALADPKGLVITESAAKRIFGDANPMGETVKFLGNYVFTLQVTGVVEDPKQSHFNFEFLLPFEVKDDRGFEVMRGGFKGSMYGYFKLADGAEPEQVAAAVKDYYLDYYKDDAGTLEALQRESYTFQSVYDIYFDSGHVTFDENFNKGNLQNTLILGAIGLFILIVACMNYINAATAKALNRRREIGVRKVFGAFKRQLIIQFMSEAFMVSLSAILLSVLLTDILLPQFQLLMGKTMPISLLENPFYLQLLLGLLVAVSMLSGLYPALIMSAFKPVEAFNSHHSKSFFKTNKVRSFLVGFQIMLTMMLISAVVLVIKQTHYINNLDLGFNKEDVLIIPNNSDKVNQNLQTYKNELMRNPNVLGVATSMDVIGFQYTNNSGYVTVDGQPNDEGTLATYFTTQMDFMEIYDLDIVNGRAFNPELSTDSTSIIVNEAFVNSIGLNDPLGKKVRIYGPESTPKAIIGVVEDFKFQSIHNKVKPALFLIHPRANWFMSVRIQSGSGAEVVDYARNLWEEMDSVYPFGYMFLEDNINAYYDEEQRIQSAIEVFAVICIIISCLGLYGMTAYVIERKIKEIGIRKVLGAQVKSLVWLVNQKFVQIFLVGTLIAIPAVYFSVSKWLEGFAYHITIGVGSFLIAGIIVLLVIISTVSIQAFKAALSNPTKTLRTE
ncbi:ABC transporter permease [Roseivirga pacifica]|uniref:ABC transporter permease n=1 Tax=Roseivirga pacifica TaxID=1267423 RepID=UPI003BAD2C0A